MKISKERLLQESEATGFRLEIIEKVFHLLHLLESLFSHPFLKGRLALKGGTALNLFIFDLPRLSIDIDLNYIGSHQLEVMFEERPKIEEALRAVFGREGFAVRRFPVDTPVGSGLSGMKVQLEKVVIWRLTSISCSGLHYGQLL